MRLLPFLLCFLVPVLAGAEPTKDDIEAAKAHFAAANAYFEQNDFANAEKEFKEALRLSARVDLLYNIARCQEELHHYGDAVETLNRYLNENLTAKDKPKILWRIEKLSKKRDEQAAKAKAEQDATAARHSAEQVQVTPAGTVKEDRVAKPRPRFLGGPIAVGIGGAMMLIAVGTGSIAHVIRGNLSNQCMGNICPTSAQNDIDRGRRLALTTDVFLPLGAAVALVGVGLFVWEAKRPAAKTARVLPTLDGLAVTF